MSDLAYLAFIAVCFWLAASYDGDGGGGKRQPARAAG
jgi:hypothetical protein